MLSEPKKWILLDIIRNGPIDNYGAKKKSGYGLSTISSSMKGLVAEGYVFLKEQILNKKDQYKKRYSLTPRGFLLAFILVRSEDIQMKPPREFPYDYEDYVNIADLWKETVWWDFEWWVSIADRFASDPVLWFGPIDAALEKTFEMTEYSIRTDKFQSDDIAKYMNSYFDQYFKDVFFVDKKIGKKYLDILKNEEVFIARIVPELESLRAQYERNIEDISRILKELNSSP